MRALRTFLFVVATGILAVSCNIASRSGGLKTHSFIPDDPELYRTIAALDSIFWKAYNTCDLETQAYFYADSIEFYHDQAGLITSKQQLIEGTRMNICGKVRRDLVPGSMEVYPLNGFGAVEAGLHTFLNLAEAGSHPSRPGRFVIVWQNKGDRWIIYRVISLH